MVDSKNNFYTSSYSKFHFPNEKDLFPNQEVYRVSVQGADTENILRVEKPGDRAGNIEYGTKITDTNPAYGKNPAQQTYETNYKTTTTKYKK